MPLLPERCTKLLGKLLEEHQTSTFLINTGWTGGPYGVGSRIRIQDTRAIVNAALDGSLANVPSEPDEIFGLNIPSECPNVDASILKPQNTWDNKGDYTLKAKDLASQFEANFKAFEGDVSDEVKKIAIKA